jgi:hypothetical protein
MKKLGKKLVAGVLCTSMILGSTMIAFADDTDADTTTLPSEAASLGSGTGTSEGYVVLDVTKVVLPTAATVDYAIDPQGLLYKAEAATYKTDGAAVYFKNTSESGDVTYSDTSDAMTIKNKSSYAVDVAVTVGVKNGSGEALSQIKLAEKDALASAKDPSLYLGVLVGADEKAVTKDGQTVSATAAAVPVVDGTSVTAGYQLVATKTAKDGVTASASGYYYYYDLTSGYTPGTDQIVSFKLTGAANGVEAWKDVTETVATSLTYTITKHSDVPDFKSTSKGVITYNTGAVKSIQSIKVTNDKGFSYDGYNAYGSSWSDASDVGGTITIDSGFMKSFATDRDAVITYTDADGETQTATITLKCAD